IATLGTPQRIRCADVHEMSVGIVRARRPIHRRKRLPEYRCLREGCEDPSIVDEGESLDRHVYGLRYYGIANGEGLCWRSKLLRLLHHRRLDDPNQGFTRFAVEDVDPAGLGGLRNGFVL